MKRLVMFTRLNLLQKIKEKKSVFPNHPVDQVSDLQSRDSEHLISYSVSTGKIRGLKTQSIK